MQVKNKIIRVMRQTGEELGKTEEAWECSGEVMQLNMIGVCK